MADDDDRLAPTEDGVGKPKSDKYDCDDRAERFNARAALCSSGHVVEEKM